MNKYWDEECQGYRCLECGTFIPRDKCLNCEDTRLGNQMSITITQLVEKVKQFQKDKGFPTSANLDDYQYLMFRNTLLLEEVSELFTAITNQDKVEIADGFADLIYIIIGTCGILDIPIEEVLNEVHRSNMTKEKGAVKGSGYKSPRIKEILEKNS